jgi:hypothetical protein
MFQHKINAESYPVSQLCVNTLPATKVTLITDGISLGTLSVNMMEIAYVKKYDKPDFETARILNIHNTAF